MPEDESDVGKVTEEGTAQASPVNHANQTTTRSRDDDGGMETDDDLLLCGSGNIDLDNAVMLATRALTHFKSACKRMQKVEAEIGAILKEVHSNEQICKKLVETTKKLKRDRLKAVQSLRMPRVSLHRSGVSTLLAGSMHCLTATTRQKPPSPLEDKEMPELLQMLRDALCERERLFNAKKKLKTQDMDATTNSIIRTIKGSGKVDVNSIECKKVALDKLETVDAHCKVLRGEHKKMNRTPT